MNKNIVLTTVLVGALAFGSAAFAGNPGQSGQSGQSGQGSQAGQAGQAGQHKPSFCSKIKKAFKKGYKKGKKAGTKTFDAVQNKVMDAGVSVKKTVTGKKNKTFVKGHYKKGGTHTKGHFRKVGKKK